MRMFVAVVFGLSAPAQVAYAQESTRPPVEMTFGQNEYASAPIGPAGGSLELKTTDGSVYTLTVPPRALFRTETIEMRPVTEVKGLPGQPTLAGGVAFEPRGLEFNLDAMLTITPGTPVKAEDVPMMWGFEGLGTAPTLIPFRIEGESYVRPIEHFSGEILAGEWWRHVPEPDFEKAVDEAREAAEAEALRVSNGITDELLAKTEAVRLKQKLALELAKARACVLAGRNDCPSLAEMMGDLVEATDKGIVEPGLRALGFPSTTCEQARQTIRTVLGYEREWQLLGVRGPEALNVPDLGKEIEVDEGGTRTKMPASERVYQLCRREAVAQCKAKVDIAGMIREILGAERQRQLLGGSSLTREQAIKEVIDLLSCTDALAELCYSQGDSQPLMTLFQAVALASTMGGDGPPPESQIAILQAGVDEIENHLKACARYRVTWESNTRRVSEVPGYTSAETIVRGKHTADVGYAPSDTPGEVGKIKGHGADPAIYDECSERLLKVTDFLSSRYFPPCVGNGPFEVEIARMTLRRAAVPAAVELRGSFPTAFVKWEQCWRYVGCQTNEVASGGMDVYLTYQYGKHPVNGASDIWVIIRNLKEPMGSPYPVLFKGTEHLKTKIQEGEFEDRSEITIEHIGKRS